MPTAKQARALANAVENGGNITKAMIDAGYSPATANNPGESLTQTKGWEELLEEYLSDDKLIQVTEEGLAATKAISALTGTSATGKTVDFVDVPDFAVRHKYLETALKLKNKLVDRTDLTTKDKPIPLLHGAFDVSGHNSPQETEEITQED